MQFRASGTGTANVVARWDGGCSWMAYPDERFRRTSHAVIVGDGVWLVDPLDCGGLEDLLADLRPVRGVAVTSDYHRRDAGVLAHRYGVAVHVPEGVDRVAGAVDAPVERFGDELAGTGFRPVRTVRRFWNEVALYHPGRRTLVVGDALATASVATDREHLHVTPYLQPWPPREALSGLDVDRVLVGHGPGVFEDAEAELASALAVPRLAGLWTLAANLPALLKAAYVASR